MLSSPPLQLMKQGATPQPEPQSFQCKNHCWIDKVGTIISSIASCGLRCRSIVKPYPCLSLFGLQYTLLLECVLLLQTSTSTSDIHNLAPLPRNLSERLAQDPASAISPAPAPARHYAQTPSLMSTAQNPTFTFPTETNGSDNGDSGGLGSRGANYFFGFLITFVVLLLIFIGCGIGSRRRFVARRNAMLVGAYEPWGPLSKDGSHFQTQPELYEKLVVDPVIEDQWRYTMVRVYFCMARSVAVAARAGDSAVVPCDLSRRLRHNTGISAHG